MNQCYTCRFATKFNPLELLKDDKKGVEYIRRLISTERCLFHVTLVLLSVLRINDILRWIRIRIRGSGSIPLTSGFGSGRAQKHVDPVDPDPQHWLLSSAYRYSLLAPITPTNWPPRTSCSNPGSPCACWKRTPCSHSWGPFLSFLCNKAWPKTT